VIGNRRLLAVAAALSAVTVTPSRPSVNGLGCLVIVFLPWVSVLLLLGVGLVGGCGLLRLDRAHVDARLGPHSTSRSRACRP